MSSRPSRGSAYYFVLVGASTASIVYLFNQTNAILLDTSIVLLPAFGVVGLAVGVSCVLRTGVKRDDRVSIVWFSFLLMTIVWSVSLAISTLYPLVYGMPTPEPSLADVFELAGYAPLLFGLLTQASPFRSALSARSMKAVMVLVVMTSVTILYLILPGFLAASDSEVVLVVNTAYPVLDVICLTIAIPILALFIQGTYWRPFLWVVVGLVFLLIGDILAGEAILAGRYYLGHPSDLIYVYGVLSGTLGWYLRKKQFVSRSL